MLIAMNKVDKEFIDQIRQSFARLDADNTGSLSKEDLVTAARSKLQNPSKKLELAAYRERLLAQAEQARQESQRRSRERIRTGSFWEDNFAFVSSVFHRDDMEDSLNNRNNKSHPLLS